MVEINGNVLLPLAIPKPPSYSVSYVPQVAASWGHTATTATIHLRKNARWSDGHQVTSRDLIDSLLLQGVNGSAVWDDLTGVSAPNNKTVVFKIRPGVSPQILLNNVLTIDPVSAAQFGRFVGASLMKEVLANYAPTSASNSAAHAAASQAISAVEKKLVAYNPTGLVSDGPYNIKSASPQQLLLSKSSTFWAASNVHVDSVLYQNFLTFPETEAAGLSGHLDVGTGGLTTTFIKKIEATPGLHLKFTSRLLQDVIYFNEHRYPFNLLAVRKAIAYVINRPITVKDVGEPNTPQKYNTGLINTPNNEWIGSRTLRKMNAYQYSPSKARQLLRGAGFHLTNGHWDLPNGKPWKLQVIGTVDAQSITDPVSGQLSAFGIESSAISLEPATFTADVSSGAFELVNDYVPAGTSPLVNLDELLGSSIDFPSSGGRGISFGPKMAVPGLGTVNVPKTLDAEAAGDGPATWKKLTTAWGELINKQLPVLQIYSYVAPILYSTRHYTDWPPKSSPLWAEMSVGRSLRAHARTGIYTTAVVGTSLVTGGDRCGTTRTRA